MNEPVTKIDPRFSDPDAVATGWDETRRMLETAELFWISTVRADGRPHVTPLVAVWLDGAIYFTTGATEQKALNLRGNPHVILMTGCNHWDAGLDVVVEVGFSLAFPEVLLDLTLELLNAPFYVLAGVVGGIAQIATDLPFHLLAGPFDLVLDTSFV